ncbi:MAG TPA: hypothetical protein VOA41_17070 [Candidatus Dormibacteraeota bacterium]|nr:hypothetical protein [Candidatus Dormibacteraeota bacterium]
MSLRVALNVEQAKMRLMHEVSGYLVVDEILHRSTSLRAGAMRFAHDPKLIVWLRSE